MTTRVRGAAASAVLAVGVGAGDGGRREVRGIHGSAFTIGGVSGTRAPLVNVPTIAGAMAEDLTAAACITSAVQASAIAFTAGALAAVQIHTRRKANRRLRGGRTAVRASTVRELLMSITFKVPKWTPPGESQKVAVAAPKAELEQEPQPIDDVSTSSTQEDEGTLEARLRDEKDTMDKMETKAASLIAKMAEQLAAERQFSGELKEQISAIKNLYSELSDSVEMRELVEQAVSAEHEVIKEELDAKTEELQKLEEDSAKELKAAKAALKRKSQNEERLVGAANKLTLQMMDAKKEMESKSKAKAEEEAALAQVQQQAEAAEKELESEKEKVKQREAERQAAVEKMSKMEAEIASTKVALTASYDKSVEVFQRKKQLEENARNLEAAPAIEASLQLRLQETAEKARMMAEEHEQLEKEKVAAKQRESQVEKALQDVKATNEDLNQTVPALEDENRELKARLSAVEGLEGDEERLALELSNSFAENEELAKQLSAMKERLAAREDQARKAAEEPEEAKKKTSWTNYLQ